MSAANEPNSVQEAIYRAAKAFEAHGIPYGMRDARRLMTAALAIPSDRLTLHLREDLPEDVRRTFDSFCDRRVRREAVSRILGGRLFYGRWFKNGPHVLDPRPETEILVEKALEHPFQSCLDIGTGSGCIGLTLLAECVEAKGVVTDISDDALNVAKENAIAHAVSDRVSFVVSNWFASVKGRFDVIVSNPPYIHPDEMDGLDPEVLEGDPHLALTDFVDGLSGYREISSKALEHLNPLGRVLVEIGPTQGKAVVNLFKLAGFQDCMIHPDLDGRDRVIEAIAPKT